MDEPILITIIKQKKWITTENILTTILIITLLIIATKIQPHTKIIETCQGIPTNLTHWQNLINK